MTDYGIDKYIKEIEDKIEEDCRLYCSDLLKYILSNITWHNITGNLINSIFVGLYKNGKPLSVYFASDKVKAAIDKKMTKGRQYFFEKDWDGAINVIYNPKTATNEDWGELDAKRFFAGYKSNSKYMFEIVVCYSTEYAFRALKSFVSVYAHAENVGLTFVKI